jgi:NADH-quinone oxidoreductase subunit N
MLFSLSSNSELTAMAIVHEQVVEAVKNVAALEISLVHFFPEIFLASSILALTMHASLLSTSRYLGYPLLTQSYLRLCLLVVGLTFCLSNQNLSLELNTTSFNTLLNSFLAYENTFVFDSLSQISKQIILIGVFFCLLISENIILKHKLNTFEYLLLLLCATLGLLFLASAYDLISLYLAIEVQSLCLYVLAAAKKNSSFSLEAGLKYFILGSFSSALFLFGASLLYGCTGTTNFLSLSLFFSGLNLDTFPLQVSVEHAWMCISIAFFFKIAAAPFHMWAPDVYEGSPTSSTVFFTVIPKIALFTVFLRLFQSIFVAFEDLFLFLLLFSAVCSVIFGSFVALRQKKLKRLLAYSSISHVGYLLLAFASNSLEGTQALFFYVIIYMITSLCAWCIVLSLNTSENEKKSKTLADLAQVSSSNPLLGLSAVLTFFSLAGVPPLAGFFAKMEIFLGAVSSSLYLTSIIAILSSVISAFFYVRLIKTMYFEKIRKNIFVYPVTKACSITLGLGCFALLFFSINPTLLLLFTQKMALCLYKFY